LNIIKTDIPEVIIIETNAFLDNRGLFTETYNLKRYNEKGFQHKFVQDNLVYSKKNVLRGLHYQINNPQGKLVQCIEGAIFDVAVDLRKESEHFLKWVGVNLNSENRKQFYIPEGFAHGYCVLSEKSTVTYKCTNQYHSEDERGIIWDDPNIKINWPIRNPLLSKKDRMLGKYEII